VLPVLSPSSPLSLANPGQNCVARAGRGRSRHAACATVTRASLLPTSESVPSMSILDEYRDSDKRHDTATVSTHVVHGTGNAGGSQYCARNTGRALR
jgi:hypothetical protein